MQAQSANQSPMDLNCANPKNLRSKLWSEIIFDLGFRQGAHEIRNLNVPQVKHAVAKLAIVCTHGRGRFDKGLNKTHAGMAL